MPDLETRLWKAWPKDLLEREISCWLLHWWFPICGRQRINHGVADGFQVSDLCCFGIFVFNEETRNAIHVAGTTEVNNATHDYPHLRFTVPDAHVCRR